MFKRIFLAVALVGAFGLAQATPGNNGGGNGGCGNGQQTNGCGGDMATGGAGGQGGSGVGIGVGIGQGGSVAGSGNSHNANTNRNTNANANLNNNRNSNKNSNRNSNLNAQAQLQGQQQGQSQRSSNRNDNRSSAANTNSNANSGNNSAQSVTVQGDHYEAPRIPVATAYAAPLVAGTNTCMGSTTAGGQGMTFGISIGSTWEDDGCTRRSNAATLFSLGQTPAAVALMCQDKAVAKAMEAAGTPCPGTAPKVAYQPSATLQPAQTQAVQTPQPIVNPVPPSVERYIVTSAGVVRVN